MFVGNLLRVNFVSVGIFLFESLMIFWNFLYSLDSVICAIYLKRDNHLGYESICVLGWTVFAL